MSHHIIGLTGPAGSGKDTAADILQEAWLRDYECKAFSDPIKRMLTAGLGLNRYEMSTPEGKAQINPLYGVTNRHLLQTLGTEWGRSIHSDIWLLAIVRRIKQPTIMTDVRFPNEAAWVRKHGTLIHLSGRGGLDGEEAAHTSEHGLPLQYGDIAIDNSGTLDDLRCRLKRAVGMMGVE